MTRKIAVSLPDEQVDAMRRAVDEGRASSVSGYVSQAIEHAERADTLHVLLDDLDSQLGPPGDEDYAWADDVLGLS
jgi:antitoxin ParD1/3/4